MARIVVAERQTEGTVCGLVSIVPPMRLMEQYKTEGKRAVHELAATMAEIDSLAVDADVRGQGVGAALLAEAEQWLADRGVRIATAKVARGNLPLMRWYRRRGYLIALQQEPIWLPLRTFELSCNDGDDGYQLAVKGLGGVEMCRVRDGQESVVTARHLHSR
ncbi:GNAT family N-acetyltransferase [Streptomyces sp. SGAir0957]